MKSKEVRKWIQPLPYPAREPSNAHEKCIVWDHFAKPYGPPKSLKTKCHRCGMEFSYHGSPSSLKYHLIHKHNIDIPTNLVQVKSNYSTSLENRKSKIWNFLPRHMVHPMMKLAKPNVLDVKKNLHFLVPFLH